MASKAILGAAVAALLSSGGAFAADLVSPPPAMASPTPAAYDWSGFYLGVFGGVATSRQDFSTDPAGLTFGVNGGGGFGGVQGGYNFDLGGAVLGVSADLALANIGGDLSASFGPGSIDAASTIDYLGTVQARVGLPWDNLLLYLHGGYAYAHEKQSITGIGPGINFDQGHSGFVVGAGVDYAINQNLSLETEYGYYNFGSTQITSLGGGSINETTSFHAVKAGLNYKF